MSTEKPPIARSCAEPAGAAAELERLIAAGADVSSKDAGGLTPLMRAAGLGRADLVRRLLEAGADPNVLDDEVGTTALHKAAQKGDVPCLELLLDHGAFLDVQAVTYGHTPLLDAIWYKNVEATRCLLERGANLNINTRYGFTLRQFVDFALKVNKHGVNRLEAIDRLLQDRQRRDEEAVAGQQLTAAILANDREAVRRLIAAGADLEERHPVTGSFDDGYTPLLVACREGRADIVRDLLVAGADARAEDATFRGAPPHKATYMGHAEVAEVLIASGKIDIDIQGPINGYTPLHDALWHGNTECARKFLEAGCRLDLRGHDGRTCLDLALETYGEDHDLVAEIRERMNPR